jgi:hypothetical protein
MTAAILTVLLESHITQGDVVFGLVVAVVVPTVATFLLCRFTADVLSSEGVETLTPLGRRLIPWKHTAAVRTFPFLKLVVVRFALPSGRSLRVLFFQRRAGEFRQMITDFVSIDSLVWEKLNDA